MLAFASTLLQTGLIAAIVLPSGHRLGTWTCALLGAGVGLLFVCVVNPCMVQRFTWRPSQWFCRSCRTSEAEVAQSTKPLWQGPEREARTLTVEP